METGRVIFLSEETIKSHRKRILQKLNAVNSVHAVRVAFERGIF